MAGSERSGYAASRANLFENAWFVLTPYPETTPESLESVSLQVSCTGAMPIVMDVGEHDHATALISHLPHAIAAMLVDTVRNSDTADGTLRRLAAGGFKDITRIASSSSALWSGICLSNREPLRDVLAQFRVGIERFLKMLEEGEETGLRSFFESARTWRDALSVARTEPYMTAAEITVDVEDKPGIIASIAVALAARDINIKNIGINHVREEDEGALLIRFESPEERDFATDVLTGAGYGVKCRA
jgi:prephenate dehydrogenase